MRSSRTGLWLLLVVVILIPILPWLVIGPRFEAFAAGFFPADPTSASFSWWLAPSGVLLLASDSFLPVPGTLLMSGLGLLFGFVLGGLLASLGVFLSGLVAYLVCRRFGMKLAARITGEKGLARVRSALESYGPVLIVATRSVPVLQEASSCLAGLGGMALRPYLIALVCGSLPTGFAYAAIGATALHDKGLAALLSILVPLLSWPLIWLLVRRSPPAVRG